MIRDGSRGAYGAGTDISGFPTVDNVIESFHHFLEGHFMIKSVRLEDVDVCSEAGNARVYGVENVLP